MAFLKAQIPEDLDDVVRRRWLALDGDTRRETFGTKGIIRSYWQEGNTFALLIGDSIYQSLASSFARSYGVPLPGVGFALGEGTPRQAAFFVHTRLFTASKMTLATSGGYGILGGPNSTFALYDLGIDLRPGQIGHQPNYVIQFAFYASLGEHLTLAGASEDLETLLVREISRHIKRVPLNAA